MADEVTLEGVQAQLAARTAEYESAQARIKALNDESKGHRLNGDRYRAEAQTAAEARDAAIAAAATKAADIEKAAAEKVTAAEAKATQAAEAAAQRAVNADLKVAAKDVGARDIADVMALLDRTKLKFSADGDVTNAADLMAELKKSKPYLFGEPNTSNPADPPKPTPPGTGDKPFKDMTAAEQSEWKRKMGLR